VHADIVDGDDVGMIQGARGLRLFGEAALAQRVGAGAGEDLDRDFALQPRVAAAIHFAHSARAEGRDDFVGPEEAGRLYAHNVVVR